MAIGPLIRLKYLELFIPCAKDSALLVGTVDDREYKCLSAKGYDVTKADLHPRDETIVRLDLTAPPRDFLGKFSLVVASDVLEHIPDDRAAVAGIFHLLRPGGVGYIHVPGGDIQAPLSEEDIKHGHVRHGYSEEQIKAVIHSQPFGAVQCFRTFNDIERQAAMLSLTGEEKSALELLERSPFDGRSGTCHLFLVSK